MTAQLDMFGKDPIAAPVVDLKTARSESLDALELLMTWKRNLDELMDALPASVFLSESERHGPAMKRAWRCYCLSPRQDSRPGSWPVVCIHPGDKDPDEHTAFIVTHDNTTVTGHVARSLFSEPPWRIVTQYAIFDMAGRFLRVRP